MSKLVQPLNFQKWINEHRHLLKPPVGNKCVWDNGEYIVMVVGGPNSRKDYHYNETPEFFLSSRRRHGFKNNRPR
jgi:3-hydroxyanthranilate 3,4-dioxygenase